MAPCRDCGKGGHRHGSCKAEGWKPTAANCFDVSAQLQTRALANLPASDASVIVATEPLWAAGFAALLLGEVSAPTKIKTKIWKESGKM